MNQYLTVNRIEFAVTYLCNSKCRHCQLGKDRQGRESPNHIDKSKAAEIVRKVGTKYSPQSIMTFGGEPLLYPDIVCSIHKEAAEVGIPVRDVITNGFWGTQTKEIQKIANNLVESGVNKVSISVDSFHQEFIPLEIVKKAAQSLVDAGMPHVSWNPCWVVSRDHDNQYNHKTKALLNQLKDIPALESEGNIAQPRGRAQVLLRQLFPPRTRMPKGKCGDIPYAEELDSVKTLYVEPDGSIDVCQEFCIGNASETDIIDLIEDYDPWNISEAGAIIESGMEGLANWAKTKGAEPDPKGYYDICHMCTDLRNKAKRTRPSR